MGGSGAEYAVIPADEPAERRDGIREIVSEMPIRCICYKGCQRRFAYPIPGSRQFSRQRLVARSPPTPSCQTDSVLDSSDRLHPLSASSMTTCASGFRLSSHLRPNIVP